MILRSLRQSAFRSRAEATTRLVAAAALAVAIGALVAPFSTQAQNGSGPNFGPVRNTDYLTTPRAMRFLSLWVKAV